MGNVFQYHKDDSDEAMANNGFNLFEEHRYYCKWANNDPNKGKQFIQHR
jgi:hypothetical protein